MFQRDKKEGKRVMNNKKGNFKIFSMIVSSLISSYSCQSKKIKQVEKIQRIRKNHIYNNKKRDLKRYKNKYNRINFEDILKFIVVPGFGIGSIFCLGILGKKFLGKKNEIGEKKDEIKKIQYEVKLSKADEEYIRKNFFICRWPPGRNLCWNNTFIQYLMCPNIRCKSVCSSRIMKVLNWINSVLREKYTGSCLERVVDVPDDVRPMRETSGSRKHEDGSYCDYKNWLKCGKFHDPWYLFYGSYKFYCNEKDINKYNTDKEGKVVNISDIADDIEKRSGLRFKLGENPYRLRISKGFVNLEDMGIRNRFILFLPTETDVGEFSPCEEIYYQFSDSFECRIQETIEKAGYNPNIYGNYLVEIAIDKDEPQKSIDLRCLDSRPFGYYPTFISFYDSWSRDYKSCYLIYDSNKEIKFVIYIDTLHDEMKVVSFDEIKNIMHNARCAYIRYSRSDIIENYFIPR